MANESTEWTAVTSSNIAAIRYEGSTRTLEIQFKSGRVYSYAEVPEEVYGELMGAESHGKYFNAEIKGRYDYAQVE